LADEENKQQATNTAKDQSVIQSHAMLNFFFSETVIISLKLINISANPKNSKASNPLAAHKLPAIVDYHGKW
jgi:hypothetical protein